MKYYNIGISDDLEVIGYYPQLEFRKGYNPRENGCFDVNNHSFPDFVPNYELELHNKAKVIDILPVYSVGFGLILSKKAKEIFKSHHLPPHAFYPMKIYHNDIVLEYFWFHYIPNDFWDFLDREKSNAIIYDNKNFQAIETIDLNLPAKEYINLELSKPYYQHLQWGKVVFKPNFPEYDIYKIKEIQSIKMISEKLKNALEEANITGHTTKLFDKLVIS